MTSQAGCAVMRGDIVNATMFDRYGDADDFLDCFIIPARIVSGTF
ncbi:hypothetical protein BvCmsL112A_04631 [Escherichia coli]|nr:hypothetical protein MPEC4969_122c00050 [Escherichia coli]GCJ26369.1 hypothetical protein BvCmsL112A_04631 [Escherichia coli]GCK35775.1 hypothetical protein BvCmsB39A_03331 [Escherichia coli]GDL59832.1 hypothetical protein BvCmsKSNP101_01081 [Escherichia coli]GDN27787.1 hypothetical protein BvCmsNSNP042_02244 [Escherichia coli]